MPKIQKESRRNIKTQNKMKKIIFVVTMLLVMTSISAASYEKAIGIEIGGINGISYKQFIIDNCAFQCDLTVGLFQSSDSSMVIEISERDFVPFSCKIDNFNGFDFKVNPNIVWQKTVIDGLDFYAGGGVSLGLFHTSFLIVKDDQNIGKFGINAMVGAEYVFAGVPIALGIDFRPGYGLAFAKGKGVIDNINRTVLLNYFDWGLGLSVRYLF